MQIILRFKNNPADPDFVLGPLPQDQQPFSPQLHDAAQLNQPAIQTLVRQFRALADQYDPPRFLMGEVDGDGENAIEVSKTFTQEGHFHATYNFDLLEWDGLSISEMKAAISKAVGAFNESGRLSFSFSNHDVPRVATRQLAKLGLDETKSRKMQLLLLKLEASLIGSTCMYQGEELALTDVQDIPLADMQDPWGWSLLLLFWDATPVEHRWSGAKQTPMAAFQMPIRHGCLFLRRIWITRDWMRQKIKHRSITS